MKRPRREKYGTILARMQQEALQSRPPREKDYEWWTRETEAEQVRRAEEEGHVRRIARLYRRIMHDAARRDPAPKRLDSGAVGD